LNSTSVASRTAPLGDEIPSSTPRALVVDLLAGAFFKLIAEGRALAACELVAGAAEVIS
jgi:hypothetical protein